VFDDEQTAVSANGSMRDVNSRCSVGTILLSRMNLPLLPCVGLLLSISFACDAQVYRWTDPDGRTHYGDHPLDARSAKPIESPRSEAAGLADVKVQETAVEWFPIRGFSTQEMRASMRETAPYSAVHHSRVWGQCRWWFEWEFKHRVEPASCRIDRFSIRLLAQMNLPRWVDASLAPGELRQKWDDFERRLR
jgi:Bacterial protein of unknown function (DUF922)/Domain of unknown function (DUF4124)